LTNFNIEKEKLAFDSKRNISNVKRRASIYLFNVGNFERDNYDTHPCTVTFGWIVLFLEQKEMPRSYRRRRYRQGTEASEIYRQTGAYSPGSYSQPRNRPKTSKGLS
jgi:hypothetical protein